MKSAAKRKSRPLDEQAETVKLCPKAMETSHFLQQTASAPNASFSLNMRLIMLELAQEARDIERHIEGIRTGTWPDTVHTEEDMATWEHAVRRARLAVQETCLTALSAHALDSGWDPGVLATLTLALSSSQVSSGDDWEKLKPVRPVRTKLRPKEVETRGQLAAIAMLHPSATERTALYEEAVKLGWKKEKARNIVLNSDNGHLNDRAFLEFRSAWYQRFQDDLAEAKKRGISITPSDFLRNPYKPKQGL